MNKKKAYCCFCGAEIPEGEGHNPQPANMAKFTVCCESCNREIVIPCRLFVVSRVRDALKSHADD